MAYHIILENVAGKLDERFCDTQEETRAAVLDIASGMDHFCDGDKIRVIETD